MDYLISLSYRFDCHSSPFKSPKTNVAVLLQDTNSQTNELSCSYDMAQFRILYLPWPRTEN